MQNIDKVDIVSRLLDIHSKMALLCSLDCELFSFDEDDYKQEARRSLIGVRLFSNDLSNDIYSLIRDLD